MRLSFLLPVLAACALVQPAGGQSPSGTVPSAPAPARGAPTPALEEAQTHWFAGRAAQAIAVLEAAAQADPNRARVRFTLAWMLQERGELARAEALLRQLVQDFPDVAEAHNNLAVIAAGRGDLDAALQALQQAVALQPEHAQAQENLGDVLMRLAQRAYRRAVKVQDHSRLQLKLSRLQEWTSTP